MDGFGRRGEGLEIPQRKEDTETAFSPQALDKYDQMLGDDRLESEKKGYGPELSPSKIEEKYDRLFEEESGRLSETESRDETRSYSNLEEMKQGEQKDYGELKAEKPPHSPNLAKWFEQGGTVILEEKEERRIFLYVDAEGRKVPYIDGYPQFPPEAKHPVIPDISIGKFTGDRNEDKNLYLQNLEEEYGLTAIPDGYALHHDSENGNMQLIRMDYHTEFTHSGGHSLFKEAA